MTALEAKERILVEFLLQRDDSLSVADLTRFLRVDPAIVERAAADLVAEGQLVERNGRYRWPVVAAG